VFFTEFEREIEPHALADFEHHIAPMVRKARRAHLQRILAGARFGTSSRPS